MAARKERPVPTLAAGDRIGDRYEILGVLGEGAMGAVYDAYHLNLERGVAIKVLHEQRLRDEAMRQRFDREARTLAAVSHPNIVGITDYGFWKDEPYIVMERLQGRTLHALLKEEGRLAPRRAADFMLQLLGALEHAHERKLVHRDLKPGNVWVERGETGREKLRLLDFGFAKFVDERVNVTADGIVAGTPTYMSPEQASASSVDARSDVYSAGVLLFQMLAGRPPFEGKSAQVVRGHLSEEPPSLIELRPALHPDWANITRRALQKKPRDRFQRAEEFARAIVLLPRDALEARDAQLGPASSHVSIEVDARAFAAEARKKRRRNALIAGGAILVAAVVAVPFVLPLLGSGSSEVPAEVVEREPEPAPREAAAEPERLPAEPAPEAREAPAEPPPNPWETLPRNADLDAIHARLAAGGQLDPADIVRLRLFGGENPNDPRPLLLRARDAITRRWFSASLDMYEQLYSTHPDARGAPEMLRDLVALVRRESVARRAAALVRRAYGREALPEIDRSLRDEGASEELTALRSAIE
jgi:serine/threonine-protein kinase